MLLPKHASKELPSHFLSLLSLDTVGIVVKISIIVHISSREHFIVICIA